MAHTERKQLPRIKKRKDDPFGHKAHDVAERYELTHPDGYQYTEYLKAPYEHKMVAELAAKGRTIQQIADLRELPQARVVKILTHPPVARFIEEVREHVREFREKYDEYKRDAATEGFDVVRGIIKGDEKPNKVRMDASALAMQMDPDGRFEPFSRTGGTRALQHNDSLEQVIEKARIIAIQATSVKTAGTPDPKEIEYDGEG